MNAIPRSLRSAVAALLTAASAIAQNLVNNGGFEAPALPVGTHYHLNTDELGSWQTTEVKFEIWANPSPSETAVEGTQHLEILDGAQTSTVSQTIPTIPGQSYVFSFYHAPRPTVNSTLTVSVNGSAIATFVETGSGLGVLRWRKFSTVFTAVNSTTTIAFSDVGTPGAGTQIDDVRVVSAPGEPLLEFVTIGDGNNPNDSADGDQNTAGVQNFGSVSTSYAIGKY